MLVFGFESGRLKILVQRLCDRQRHRYEPAPGKYGSQSREHAGAVLRGQLGSRKTPPSWQKPLASTRRTARD